MTSEVLGLNEQKDLPTNAGDTREVSLIPGLERSPGEGNGNPLQDSCPQLSAHAHTQTCLWDASFFPLRIKIIVLRPSGKVYVLT